MSTADAMTALTSAFGTAVRDLAKFKIVSAVNTGDKTQDSLVIALLLSLMALAFAAFSLHDLKSRFYLLTFKRGNSWAGSNLTCETKQYYTTLAENNKAMFKYATWLIEEDNINLGIKVANFYYTIYGGTSSMGDPSYYDFKKKIFTGNPMNGRDNFETFKVLVPYDKLLPIYVNGDGMICIIRSANSRHLYIAYNNDSTLQTFMKLVEALDVDDKGRNGSNNKVLGIFEDPCNGDTIRKVSDVYLDRTFDMFVSKYKTEILRAIDAFVDANENGARLGGYGTYNLGIMVHGDPGTGKTLLIKALANRLKRKVIIVNMRNIKTKKDFVEVFQNYQNAVYCLDEFDFVQNVIQQRKDSGEVDDAVENHSKRELRELRNRKLELLRIATISEAHSQSSNSKQSSKQNQKNANTDVPESHLEKELNDIEQKIKNIENALTLDTVLTVLDGINEMRGRVIVATTNYLDQIDKALMRAGRFDLKINLGKFNSAEIRDMLNLMFRTTATAADLALIENAKFKEEVFAPVDVIYQASINRTVVDTVRTLSV